MQTATREILSRQTPFGELAVDVEPPDGTNGDQFAVDQTSAEDVAGALDLPMKFPRPSSSRMGRTGGGGGTGIVAPPVTSALNCMVSPARTLALAGVTTTAGFPFEGSPWMMPQPVRNEMVRPNRRTRLSWILLCAIVLTIGSTPSGQNS